MYPGTSTIHAVIGEDCLYTRILNHSAAADDFKDCLMADAATCKLVPIRDPTSRSGLGQLTQLAAALATAGNTQTELDLY